MTKNYVLCILLILVGWSAKGQIEFHFAAGFGAFLMDSQDENNPSPDYWSAGVTAAPRLNLFELTESASFSVGTQLSATFMVQKRGVMDVKETRFGFDAPIYLAFNVGRAATYYSTEQVGVFAGAGFDYASQMVKIEDGPEFDVTSSGAMIIGGILVEVGNGTLGANISKTFSRGMDKLDGLAIRLMYHFGDY